MKKAIIAAAMILGGLLVVGCSSTGLTQEDTKCGTTKEGDLCSDTFGVCGDNGKTGQCGTDCANAYGYACLAVLGHSYFWSAKASCITRIWEVDANDPMKVIYRAAGVHECTTIHYAGGGLAEGDYLCCYYNNGDFEN